MINYESAIKENIKTIIPYKPGMSADEVKRLYGLERVIKLASNENPLGVSQLVKKALIEKLDGLNIYPSGDVRFLREKLAYKLGVAKEELIFGNGSNEIIELLFKAFVNTGEGSLSVSPSFSEYGLIAQGGGSFCKYIDLDDDFTFNFDKIKVNLDKNIRLVFLSNPNNPTGTYFNEENLIAFLDSIDDNILVVLDEAYAEFADAGDFPDAIQLQKKYPNIIIMRTFSKAYGLAGLRVGYAIGNKKAIDYLNRVRQPFNVNSAAQIAAFTALDDTDFLRRTIKNNREGKVYLYKEFKNLNLHYFETQANFILVDVGFGQKVFEALLKEGVIVRYMGEALSRYIRVTIGNMEENMCFIDKLRKSLKENL